jgi:hypothetical protein
VYRHYASSRFVVVATFVAAGAGFVTYVALPYDALPVASGVVRNLWVALGPIGAFCIQILMQLLTLGEDKGLTASEQERLSIIADERVRYLWDLTGVAILALLICLSAGSSEASPFLRTLLGFGVGLAAWTGLLAARLPRLYLEIRNFRWRLARERNEEEARSAALAELAKSKDERDDLAPENHQMK